MANVHHSNPFLSILSGSIAGFYAFIQNHGFVVENFYELLKVISFGIIGGACGYIGKFLAMRIHKFFKDKSKEVCK